MLQIMPPAVFGLGQSGLMAAFDELFAVGAFFFELLGSGYLLYDVASLVFDDIMPQLANPVKMGLNYRLLLIGGIGTCGFWPIS